jgi:hypothetical protein
MRQALPPRAGRPYEPGRKQQVCLGAQGLEQRMLESLPESERQELGTDVLNGIAWDEEGRRLFVTGKLWPRLFQVGWRGGQA